MHVSAPPTGGVVGWGVDPLVVQTETVTRPSVLPGEVAEVEASHRSHSYVSFRGARDCKFPVMTERSGRGSKQLQGVRETSSINGPRRGPSLHIKILNVR